MRLKTFCEDISERRYMDEEINTFCANIEKSGGKIINIRTEVVMDSRIYAIVSVVYKEKRDK